MGKFEITRRSNKDYQFNLKAGNHQVILTSEGYGTLEACKNGIESVIRNSAIDARFERKDSKNGKVYFNLKASNGQVIGKSEMYESKASMEKGIAAVKENVTGVSIEVLT